LLLYQVGERVPIFTEELGISVSSVTLLQLRELILSGDFAEQTHLGVITLAQCRGMIAF
jgi:hypothetical protein